MTTIEIDDFFESVDVESAVAMDCAHDCIEQLMMDGSDSIIFTQALNNLAKAERTFPIESETFMRVLEMM